MHEAATIASLKHRTTQLGGILQDKSFDQYEQSLILRRAVEHCYWIIGKLMTRLLQAAESPSQRTARILNLSGFDVDFADRLVAEYENVNDREVWSTIHESLPKLREQIDAWAAELGMEPPPERAA